MARSRVINLDGLRQFQAINLLLDPGHIGGPVVIPFLVKMDVAWNLTDGKVAHNVLYGRTVGTPAPTVAQAQAIYAGITSGALWTALNARLASTSSIASVTLTSVHTAGLPSFSSTGAAVPGSDVAIALPNEVAICVTWRSAGRGASNRGRMYVPSFAIDQVLAANTITAGAVTDVAAWANNIRTVMLAQGLTQVIAQPARAAYTGITGTQHPARAAGSVDVTAGVVRDNRWDSQRRRGLK